MSGSKRVGPKRGGQTLQRNQPRTTRQEQREQRRVEREQAEKRERQRRLIARAALFGGGGLVAVILAFVIVNAIIQARKGPPVVAGTGTFTTAVNGGTRDGMSCLGTEGTVEHIHMYLAIYVDGQQIQVPANTGIVNNGACFYPLHVHGDAGDENIIHEESPNNNVYTLGAFFDIWGQQLSKTQVMVYKADATHALKFITIDANGKQTVVTGNPLDIRFTEHETIYILYNSPNVTPTPFKRWIAGE
jgi:hypothetical protein